MPTKRKYSKRRCLTKEQFEEVFTMAGFMAMAEFWQKLRDVPDEIKTRSGDMILFSFTSLAVRLRVRSMQGKAGLPFFTEEERDMVTWVAKLKGLYPEFRDPSTIQ